MIKRESERGGEKREGVPALLGRFANLADLPILSPRVCF